MNEMMRATIKEVTAVIEALPASISRLGDGALTSVAVAAPAPTIIITTAKRVADE